MRLPARDHATDQPSATLATASRCQVPREPPTIRRGTPRRIEHHHWLGTWGDSDSQTPMRGRVFLPYRRAAKLLRTTDRLTHLVIDRPTERRPTDGEKLLRTTETSANLLREQVFQT